MVAIVVRLVRQAGNGCITHSVRGTAFGVYTKWRETDAYSVRNGECSDCTVSATPATSVTGAEHAPWAHR